MTSTSPAPARARPGRRGPRTAAGKARAARNALKHGMRAAKYVVLPDEDVAEFAALEAALVEELAPVGALQNMLARRVAVAAWRLARADRIEAEVFAERSYGNVSAGLALMRDGNGTRSFETLLRYRGAAMAEFWRALRTLKALQAEQAMAPGAALAAGATRSAPRRPCADGPRPRQPEPPARRLHQIMPEPPPPGRALHEGAAPWLPDEPAMPGARVPNEPEAAAADRPDHGGRCRAAVGGSPAAGHARRPAVIAARLAELVRSPAVLEALRAAAGEVPGAGPALLEPAGATTKRIQEASMKTMT